MENRDKRLAKLYSPEEKYEILYRQLVKKESLRTIYQDFKKNITYEYFKSIPSILFYEKELLAKVVRRLAINTPYEDTYRTECMLGSKEESYWQEEADVLFKPITKDDLSEEEMLLYLGND